MTLALSPGYIFKVANERLKADPLLSFGWPGEPHRLACRYHAQGLETLLRGSNDAAKTGTGSAIVTAILEGKKSLNGEPLPDVPMPAVWWVLVQSYKQQVDASQAWVLRWLGDHPHRLVNGAKGYVEHIFIATPLCSHSAEDMSKAGFRCKTCSKLVFHCAESPSGIGGKIDGVWADEPPDEDTWREMRRRGRGNRIFYKLITATPVEKKWWHWMPADFHQVERKPRDGRVEVRATMDDNRFLLPAVKAQKIADTKGDPRERARLYGDYVDLKGESPFPPERLEIWLKRCRPPRIERVSIEAERQGADDEVRAHVQCAVQIFHPYEREEHYVGVVDSATFLRLDHRTGLVATAWTNEGSSLRNVPDPCGIHIYARRKPRLAMRFVGYTGAYGIGSLAAKMAVRYGNALIDTDLSGGHGDPAVRALRDAGYFRLHRNNPISSRPGGGSSELGFKMNASNRAEMVASIQQALLNDSVLIESEDCIRSFMAVTYVMTPSGKERPEASYGAKDEDMICAGRALHLMQTLMLPPLPQRIERDPVLAALGIIREPTVRRVQGGVLWDPD